MPSTRDADGKRDLWTDWDDVFGSVANYFAKHGWRTGEPVMEPATRPERFAGPEPRNSLDLGDTVGSLAELGYVFTTTLPSDAPAAAYSFEAAGGGSEYWVGYHNFHVVTRYNRSTKYALAAHQLSQAIRSRYFETVASNSRSVAPVMLAGTRAVRTCAALLAIGSLAACAGNAPQRAAEPARDIASRPGTSSPRDVHLARRLRCVAAAATRRSTTCSASAITCCRRARAMSQRGVASWYGRDFHGLATSSGETYNMHAMTAAHTTLPLPTWVEVTNLVNGKRVVVKVNDRGPFVDNRLIDLSYAAATALDMVGTGTTRVEVRAVAPPRDGSAPARPWPPPQRCRRLLPAPQCRGRSSGCSCRSVRSRSPRMPSGSSRACARAASRIRPSSASPTTGARCTACCWGRLPTPSSSTS